MPVTEESETEEELETETVESLTELETEIYESLSEIDTSALISERAETHLGEVQVTEDGYYYYVEEVALYIATYGHLPSNYITKDEAQELGWVSSKGNLWKVAPGMCIGGDRFGNYEGKLPTKKGRKYTECDVNYEGGYRQTDRIIFSNDGLVYYTEDHYETFTLLYGEE
ncbi:MAG: ribonuclease [Lachnospiraceae bacterium]|nr:ribonuclease [Lachnospiraceae bacterium]